MDKRFKYLLEWVLTRGIDVDFTGKSNVCIGFPYSRDPNKQFIGLYLPSRIEKVLVLIRSILYLLVKRLV